MLCTDENVELVQGLAGSHGWVPVQPGSQSGFKDFMDCWPVSQNELRLARVWQWVQGQPACLNFFKTSLLCTMISRPFRANLTFNHIKWFEKSSWKVQHQESVDSYSLPLLNHTHPHPHTHACTHTHTHEHGFIQCKLNSTCKIKLLALSCKLQNFQYYQIFLNIIKSFLIISFEKHPLRQDIF
jgi:hypothetical protein